MIASPLTPFTVNLTPYLTHNVIPVGLYLTSQRMNVMTTRFPYQTLSRGFPGGASMLVGRILPILES